MATWTDLSDRSWQDIDIAKEIAFAFNKRLAAANSPVSTLEQCLGINSFDTDRVAVYDFVSKCQEVIENLCLFYAYPYADKITNGVLIPNFASFEAFMITAGLPGHGTPYGWHRVPDGQVPVDPWPDYSNWIHYGQIQPMDLAGPWLYDDIRKALNTLKRLVYHTYPETANRLTCTGYGYPTITDDPDYVATFSHPRMAIYKSKDSGGNITGRIGLYTYSPGETISGLTSESKVITTVYKIGNPQTPWTNDFYNFGMSTWVNGLYVEDYTYPATNETSKTVEVLGYMSDWAWVDTHLPDNQVPTGGMASRGIEIQSMWWVVDYDFSP